MSNDQAQVAKSVPRKLAGRVMHWDDERDIGNAIIISLKYGWRFICSDCHTVGVDTVKEGIQALRESVPCGCNECAAAASK